MATESQVAVFIRDLMNSFPYYKPEDPEGFINTWIEALIPFTNIVLRKCLEKIQIEGNKFFPSLPPIKRLCLEIERENNSIDYLSIERQRLKDRIRIRELINPEECDELVNQFIEQDKICCANQWKSDIEKLKKNYKTETMSQK